MSNQLQALMKDFEKNAALAGILERRRRLEGSERGRPATRTTRHKTARQEGGSPSRKSQSRPNQTPAQAIAVGQTKRSLSATYIYKGICSLSARTSAGRRPTIKPTRTVFFRTVRCRPKSSGCKYRKCDMAGTATERPCHHHTLINFEQPCNLLTVIICQLPSLYDTDTETTSQDPNYNICSTHAIYFCRGD